MICVSLDQKRLQLSCNPFWYKSKKEAKDQKPIQLSTKTKTWERDKTQENITTKRAKRRALSQQVITRLQRTDKKARQTQNINNNNDPQKKHRLRTVSKKYFHWRS